MGGRGLDNPEDILMNIRTFAVTLSVSALATPALADLTADDVLSALTDQIGVFDLLDVSVQGQKRSGDTLSVARISATTEIDDAPLTISFGPLTYQELGDGSVAILYPEPMTAQLTTVDGDTPVVVSVDITLTDASHIATGSPDNIRYAFSAPKMQMSNLSIEAKETLTPMLDATMTGISSVVEIATGDTYRTSLDYSLDTMTAEFQFAEPDGANSAFMKFAMADVTTDYELEATLGTLMTSVAQALRDGNRLSMNMTTGEYIQDMRITTPYDQSVIASRTGASTMTLSIDKNGVIYEAGYDGSTAEMTSSGIPFGTLTYELGETDMRLAFPLLPSDDAQPFAMRLSMLGVSVGESLWSLFDPAGQLPRTPMDLVVDLDGTTRVTEDFLDLEALDAMDQPPFEDTILKLNELRLAVAGAELTGDGEVQDTSENGIPSGIGQLNMMLTGGNGLLDTLVAMGLVPEDQAMGARMMLGMFARPGDGEDTLVSTIEVKEDGSVTANGQRIK